MRSAGACAAVLLLLCSCNLLALHRDLREAATAGKVTGKVLHSEADDSAVVVFALRVEPDAWVANNYVHLATPRDFIMRLSAGKRYVIGAFADRNGNLRPDGDEPAVIAPDSVAVAQGWKGIAQISLVLAPDSRLDRSAVEALQGLAQVERRPLPVWVGEVTDLDDERLSAESAVAVSSQLHPEAVRDARKVLGFTENHTSVLSSPAVIDAYRRILMEAGR